MNVIAMQKLIEVQKKMIANQQGQIDALKGVQADSSNVDYLSGYGYQYAMGEISSAHAEMIF